MSENTVTEEQNQDKGTSSLGVCYENKKGFNAGSYFFKMR